MKPSEVLANGSQHVLRRQGGLTNDHETNKHRTRSTGLESASRTNEQTSTDRTTTVDNARQHVYRRGRLSIRSYMAIICMCLPLSSRWSLFSPTFRLSRSAGLPFGDKSSLPYFSPTTPWGL
jgi:hypothetical protein